MSGIVEATELRIHAKSECCRDQYQVTRYQKKTAQSSCAKSNDVA
jgi:hypothetical protein